MNRGGEIRFRHMSADRQLAVSRAYPALLPSLLLRGLSTDDAVALAHNAAFLYYALEPDPPLPSPDRVLERFSLGEIARLCELYAGWEDTGLEIAQDVPDNRVGESVAEPGDEDASDEAREVESWA